MQASNLKNTKLYTMIKGLDLGGPSKTLLSLHQV